MAYNRRKRKAKRDITEGQAHIHSTFNNSPFLTIYVFS